MLRRKFLTGLFGMSVAPSLALKAAQAENRPLAHSHFVEDAGHTHQMPPPLRFSHYEAEHPTRSSRAVGVWLDPAGNRVQLPT